MIPTGLTLVLLFGVLLIVLRAQSALAVDYLISKLLYALALIALILPFVLGAGVLFGIKCLAAALLLCLFALQHSANLHQMNTEKRHHTEETRQ